jgi:hypothetical protein
VFAGASTGILAAIGIALHVAQGVPARVPAQVLEARRGNLDPWLVLNQDDWACYDRIAARSCQFGNQDAPERWILVGDSHLAAFAQPLLEHVLQRHGHLLMMTRGACPYAPLLEMRANGRPDVCTYEEGIERRRILLAAPASYVVIGGRMPMYLSGTGFDNGEGGVESVALYSLQFGPLRQQAELVQDSVEEQILAGFRELLDAGHRLILIYPVPEMAIDVPRAVFHDRRPPGVSLVSVPQSRVAERARNTHLLYDSLPDHPNLLRIRPDRLFCDTLLPGRL